MKHEYIFTGICYVLHQGIFNEILYEKNNLILYPEQSLTLLQLANGHKWETSIVTENPWLISCYDNEDVFICRNGEWVNPKKQTFGASVNVIMSDILGIRNTIPTNIIGLEEIGKLEEKIRNFYKKSLVK